MHNIMNESDNMTIGNILNFAEGKLRKAGIDSAKQEAEIILGFFSDLNRSELYINRTNNLSESVFNKIKCAIKKRCDYIPLQYITGETFFYGLKLIIHEGVFVPRPETEILVEKITKIAEKYFSNKLKILELCTGSGNISVSLTKNIQYCTIISSDINTKALELARYNAQINNVNERIDFFQSNLLDFLHNDQKYEIESNRFDVIVANPPYVSSDQMKNLPDDVLNEPKEALDGGSDGLDFYRKIVEQSRRYLKKQGYIAFEFGDDQAKSIEGIIKQSNLFDQIEFFSDLNGIYRFVIARCING